MTPISSPPPLPTLRTWLGGMDIYVLDQLLRGRLEPGMRVLDAGCGGGRNLFYLAAAGFRVAAVDSRPEAVAEVGRRAADLGLALPAENLRVEDLSALSFEDGSFDAVICSAVLHFARDEAHFRAMVRELWRVLAPGGLLFTRLASTIGLEDAREAGTLVPLPPPAPERWYALPDGSERFLVDLPLLLELTRELGGTLLDPIKTTDVQGLRAMTTWVVGKA